MSDRIELGDEPWKAIPRRILRDPNLSPRAKGGLVSLLSHDEGWVRSVIGTLMRENDCGRDQARAIVRELVDAGYAEQSQERGAGGRFRTAYIVHAQARPPAGSRASTRRPRATGTPSTVPPGAVFPSTVVEPTDVEPTDVLQTLAPSKSARERDPLWDVLVECYGEPMRKAKGAWNSAVGDLREVGADPDELRAFILACRDTDKAWATVTPTAAAKHFGQRKLLTRRADDLRARAERLMA